MNDRTSEENWAGRILTRAGLCAERERLRAAGRRLAFTNGCFDLLHTGHVSYLQWARATADALAVGLNADESVRRLKGPLRPLLPETERAQVLAALRCVDYVTIFTEDEPADLIAALTPDVLVKGEDWAHYVSGREAVEAAGGRVALAPLVPGRSTSGLIARIIEAYGRGEQP
ncbi:MAG: adenylyltransferase/cytidyltransferase family protein [Candidatus Marinimicrobia bacterium]|nr:adenylyltransferase/cytidyltransferase family protein [Candidatus Neomarinimicrobiota bacterium]